jgi:hypothetical protein
MFKNEEHKIGKIMKITKADKKPAKAFGRVLGVICVSALAVMIMSGCGSLNPIEADEESDSGEEEQYVAADIYTEEEYLALAESYRVQGLIRRQRDVLEQCVRLFDSSQALDILSDIYVNLEEEDEAIVQQAELMYQNMELEDYRAEGLHVAESDEWFSTMMPKLSEGMRNYYKAQDGKSKLDIRVGYDEDGVKYTNVWYYGDDDRVLYISYKGVTAQLMETSITEGAYNGEFELWTMNGATGDITHEKGNFNNGQIAEEGYSISFREGAGEGDVYDLWSMRETFEYEELDSYGGAPGKSQLSAVAACPIYEAYEPVEDAESAAYSSQVRIFDGEIQLLTEHGWISLGTVEDFAKEDPFLSYAEAKKLADAQPYVYAEDESEEGTASDKDTADTTKTDATAKNDTTTTTKPSAATPQTTTKPATTTKPSASTATQTPASTPSVSQDDDNDSNDASSNDNSDSGSNTGSAESGNDSGSADSGSDSGSSNNGGDSGSSDSSGDVDIEWTEDIL